MKRNWFAIIIVVYGAITLLAALSFYNMSYVEQASWNRYFRAHVLIRLIVAALLGALLFSMYKRSMPEQYAKRKDKLLFKILAPVLLVFVVFIMNTLILLPLNEEKSAQDKPIVVKGIVASKYYRSGKGRTYFLVVIDSQLCRKYTLQVKKRIYEEYSMDSAFDKIMTEGMLGIIYRKKD